MTEPIACPGCGAAYKLEARFCAGCGHARTRPAVAPPSPGSVPRAIAMYLALLAVQVVTMIYVKITDDVFTAVVGGTLGLALVILAFSLASRAMLSTVAHGAGFGPLGYLLIAGAAVPILLLVVGYVTVVAKAFGIHTPDDLAMFAGHARWWPIVITVIVPPLIEELGFRGVMFGGLRGLLTARETIVVTAFAFALLHLSLPALLTHVPLGLYFGWLRSRSGSLWPGVFAHACHNLGVIVLALVA